MESREIVLALSLLFKGDIEQILEVITKKQYFEVSYLKEVIKNFKGNYISIFDEIYPASLRAMPKPPVVLYYKGNIDLLNKEKYQHVSFVGSRYASSENKKNVYDSAAFLSKKETVVVVSGLAKGIDTSAAFGALASGRIIGIIGSGLDVYYPEENRELQDEIAEKGLLLSEYPLGSTPDRNHFPFRNRVVVGLSNVVVVGEGKNRSGTAISVCYALESGRCLAVYPTLPNREYVNNALIKDGAFLVENGEDIFYLLDYRRKNY